MAMTRTLVAALIALTLAVTPIAAHVSVPIEFRKIVVDSSLIIRGRVTDVRAIRLAAGGVESVATFQVASVLKGAADQFVSVRVPGGLIGRYRFVMTGAPRFAVNEQAVLFLKRDGENNWRLVGLSQGVYRVQAEARTGGPIVENAGRRRAHDRGERAGRSRRRPAQTDGGAGIRFVRPLDRRWSEPRRRPMKRLLIGLACCCGAAPVGAGSCTRI
jgi:hypothetical protein